MLIMWVVTEESWPRAMDRQSCKMGLEGIEQGCLDFRSVSWARGGAVAWGGEARNRRIYGARLPVVVPEERGGGPEEHCRAGTAGRRVGW